MAIEALLLDVDDTIVDTRAAMVAAGTEAASVAWAGHDDDTYAAVGRHFHGDPGGFFDRFTRGELTFQEMRLARVRELPGVFDLGVVADCEALFEDAYAPAFERSVRLFPDVEPLLVAAESAGVQVGLLTNSAQAYTEVKLRAVGFEGRFPLVATRDTLGFGKPDPRVFAHCCGARGLPPESVLAVGDNLAWDVLGPMDAGMPSAWLVRPGAAVAGEDRALAAHRGVSVVTTLAEVTTLWGAPDLGLPQAAR